MTRKYGERKYPQGVDPSKVDNTHNSRGDRSPYTANERKQAAALVRTLEQSGIEHNKAMDIAFDTIGLPETLKQKLKESGEDLKSA